MLLHEKTEDQVVQEGGAMSTLQTAKEIVLKAMPSLEKALSKVEQAKDALLKAEVSASALIRAQEQYQALLQKRDRTKEDLKRISDAKEMFCGNAPGNLVYLRSFCTSPTGIDARTQDLLGQLVVRDHCGKYFDQLSEQVQGELSLLEKQIEDFAVKNGIPLK